MSVDDRAFIAKYSRLLRKKLASKLLVDAITRHTLCRFRPTRRWFHLYLSAASPSDVAHDRIDPGVPVTASASIDERMEAHLKHYGRDLEAWVTPGRLSLSTDLRVYAIGDCAILPWLGQTIHQPTEQVLDGGIDAQPRLVSRTRRVAGLVASLVDTPRGHSHYFHFFERLTMLMRALRWQGEATPVTLLVRDKLSSYQKVAVEALAKRRPNLTLMAVENYEIVLPERLLLIKRGPGPLICCFALTEEWREIGAMMRDAYGPAPDGPSDRRIYLSRRRQKVRRILNEEALEPIFAKHGYEIIIPETLSHAQQVHLMMQTRAMAAAEGAAATSIIFADKPVRLSLMRPREILYPLWEGLVLLGHEFDYVESGQAQWYDGYEVDPTILDAALERPLRAELGEVTAD